jgi:NADH:ubiquinone oxidoreductase subunit F (NADH-binding)
LRQQKQWSGHGGIVVFDDTVNMAAQARFAMEFCAVPKAAESAHHAALDPPAA